MEVEEDRIKFLMYQTIFENIINICNHHNKQSLEMDIEYNHPTCRQALIDKLKNRHMYLDIYIKTQLATLKDMFLYFNSSFCFGHTKFIDIDNLIITCNNEIRQKFSKYMYGNEVRFEVQTYKLFKM